MKNCRNEVQSLVLKILDMTFKIVKKLRKFKRRKRNDRRKEEWKKTTIKGRILY